MAVPAVADKTQPVGDTIALSRPELSFGARLLLGFAGLGFAGYRKPRRAASTAF
jgi:hypothetical protein